MLKKRKNKIIIMAVIIVVLIGFISLIPKNENVSGPYYDFIECIKDSGAKMYGNYASQESLSQMSFFGDSLYDFERSGIYIECNEYGPNPKPNKCVEAGIDYYPTWIIKEIPYEGVQGLNKLSQLTGCSYES